MSNGSLGSYYVSLGMKADHDSFDKAKRSSDNVSNSIARLVGTVRNSSDIIAAGLGALSVGAATSAAKNIEAASAMGISAKSLKDWATVALLAGKDAKSLQSEMSGLSKKFTQERNGHGEAIASVYTAFGQLTQQAREATGKFTDVSTATWRELDISEQTRLVFRMEESVKDQKKAALLGKNILGGAGESLYASIKTSGKDFDGMMKEARGISFYYEEKARTAAGFSEQPNRTGAAMKNIADSLGTSVGAELAPVLERLNDFLYSNRDNIQKTIDKIAAGVGTVVKSVEHIVGWLNKNGIISGAGEAVKGTAAVGGRIMQITEGLITKDSDKTKQGFAKVGKTLLGPELYEERQEKQNEINTQYIKKQEEIDKTKNGALWLFNSAKNLGNKELKTLGMNYNIGNARINGAKSIKENEEINTLRSRLVDYTFKGGRTTRIELDSLPVDIQEAVLRLGIDKFLEYMINRKNNYKGFATTDSITTDKVVEFLDTFSFQVRKNTFVVLDNATVHRNHKVKELRPIWEKRGLFLFLPAAILPAFEYC